MGETREILTDWLWAYKKAADGVRYTLEEIALQKAKLEGIGSSLSFTMGWTGELDKDGNKVMVPLCETKSTRQLKDNSGDLDALFNYIGSLTEQIENAKRIYAHRCRLMSEYITDPRSIQAIKYRYFMGCSNSEAGDRLGVSGDHASKLINAGLDELECATSDQGFQLNIVK